jgi:protein-disulfide isomerase
MVITVYAGCCGADKALAAVDEAKRQAGVEAEVRLVRDLAALARAGILSTPTIKINDRVVADGRVPKVAELVGWLTTAAK